MKKIYISGPMTGYKDHNFPAFNEAATKLRALGWDVVNPVDINPDQNTSWLRCIAADVAAMEGCTDIVLLPGYGKSDGSFIERIAAEHEHFTFHHIADLIQAEAA